MLTCHDRAIVDYMTANHNGKCAYSAKKCDGLCNNCPHDYLMEIESHKASGDYIPDYSKSITRETLHHADYESLILKKQDCYEY